MGGQPTRPTARGCDSVVLLGWRERGKTVSTYMHLRSESEVENTECGLLLESAASDPQNENIMTVATIGFEGDRAGYADQVLSTCLTCGIPIDLIWEVSFIPHLVILG